MNSKTKKIITIGTLCAITYVIMAVGRIPVVLFLKYDPSDVIVTLGGLIWGPMTSCVVAIIVATIEMITVSDTGILGCIMNIVQTISFACTASAIYKEKRTMSGAVISLFAGCAAMVAVMMLWNYLITPLYMGYPRETVAELLLPAFFPFNLLKSMLNAAITFLLYKPVSMLYSSPQTTFTKEQIYERVWHEPANNHLHAVENTIFQIRKRLKPYCKEREYIKTVIGYGYKFHSSSMDQRHPCGYLNSAEYITE